MTIDVIDRQILEILQQNARTSNAEIARQVGLAPSAVFERIRKLEERGVIRGYHAQLDPRAIGLDLTAFVLVRSDEGSYHNEVGRELATFAELLEVHNIAGEDCYIVKVRARDPLNLAETLRSRLTNLTSKVFTKTTIVLETLKESTALDLNAAETNGTK